MINRDTKQLRFHVWFPGCPMEEDAYGIPKPKDTEAFEPALLLVPCVGYGPKGLRLGYGGGFYDRTLAALRPRPFTVGLGYAHGYVPWLRSRAARRAAGRHADRGRRGLAVRRRADAQRRRSAGQRQPSRRQISSVSADWFSV